jgi:hypothetical protein
MTPRDGLLEQARPLPVSSRAAPAVEIVVPVRDEERDLGPSVRRLDGFLRSRFPFPARITIADNGSTDGTWKVATGPAAELGSVRAVRLAQAGRGRALRSIWAASDADVLAYMDVDLSTDLNALLPLVAPLVSGHSDMAIGTRPGAGRHQAGRRPAPGRAQAGIMPRAACLRHRAAADRRGAGGPARRRPGSRARG